MSARVMNALGAFEPGADDLRHRRHGGHVLGATACPPRWIPRSGRSARHAAGAGAGTRCPPRRTCGASSCSRRAGRGATARGGGSVPQPDRARGGRASQPSAGHRRGAGPRHDARRVDAGLRGRGLVPRVHRRLRRAARECWPSTRWSAAPEICGVPADAIGRVGPARSLPTGPRSCGSGGRPAPPRCPRRLLHHCLPFRFSPPLGASRGRRMLLHPHGHRCLGGAPTRLEREDLRPQPVRKDQHVPARARAHRPGAGPAVRRLCVWNSNPALDRPRSEPGARRARTRGPVHRRARAVHDGHRPAGRRSAAGHHRARAPDVVFSWGHHYMTWNEPAIAPEGEALPNTEAFRRLAARLGLTDPCFRDSDEEMVAAMLANSALAGREGRAARARLAEGRSGPGSDPARRGRLRHDAAGGPRSAPATRHRARSPTPRWPSATPWR